MVAKWGVKMAEQKEHYSVEHSASSLAVPLVEQTAEN
jgi:hypothetical protein